MNKFGLMATLVLAFALPIGTAWTDAEHADKPEQHISQMMQNKVPGMIDEGMLAFPVMDAARGRELFANKGCVVCHAVNGIGGEDAARLDASTMQPMMDPFEFAAKMWRGAEAMVAMQRDELGEPIELTGRELADIIAFVHSYKEQAEFSKADVPEKILKLIGREDTDEQDDDKKE